MSLKIAVPYTSRTKPTICNHLKVSQPRPRETSQMKSVRHVSMVDRAVADIDRVTLRPKKLNPLAEVSIYCVRRESWSAYPIDIMIKSEVIPIAL